MQRYVPLDTHVDVEDNQNKEHDLNRSWWSIDFNARAEYVLLLHAAVFKILPRRQSSAELHFVDIHGGTPYLISNDDVHFPHDFALYGQD